jgi:ABC-2 type transport system ATP-binding protein
MVYPIIKLNKITKTFGKHIVLDSIDLEVTSGEIFGIIGMSGSGKTTLLNTMIGFIEPNQGDVLFKVDHLLEYEPTNRFRSVYKHMRDVKTTFGFASQMPSFYGKLTCVENLNHFGAMYGLSKEIIHSNTKILLKLMNLYESKDVLAKNLSGGMRKRLDIACALIHDPKVLILDEPTGDLDPIMRKQMWGLIKKINEKGTTILLSSHFLDEVETLCDRIGILHLGKIVNSGTANELKKLHRRPDEIHLETLSAKYDLIIKKLSSNNKLKIKDIINKGHKLIIQTDHTEHMLHYLLHYIENSNEHLLNIEIVKPNLEEVFEDLTGTDILDPAGQEQKAV